MFVDIRMWPIRMIFISPERYGSVDIEYLNPILIIYFDHEVISHTVWLLFTILFIFKFILPIFKQFPISPSVALWAISLLGEIFDFVKYVTCLVCGFVCLFVC